MHNQLVDIIKTAGQMFKEAVQIKPSEKTGYRDLVTQYDIAVEHYLEDALAKLVPGVDIIGEEGKPVPYSDHCFIVDPIDGTSNFAYGLKKSACSIAYAKHGEVLAGYVYDPYLDELFYAHKNEGAFLNGKRLEPIQGDLKHGLTLMGTNPYLNTTLEETFALAKACFEHSMDVRRFGAASLDICYIASGRAVLFFEGCLSPWDFAAGSLIAKESGLVCKNWAGDNLNLFAKNSFVCANPIALNQWFEIYKGIKGEE